MIAHIPGREGLGSRTMYAAKMAFDRAVARELPPADAVLGIYGSAALTLRAARDMGALLSRSSTALLDGREKINHVMARRGGGI